MKKISLSKEIILILALKAIMLFGLWFFCFSKEPDKAAMPDAFARHVFNAEPKST